MNILNPVTFNCKKIYITGFNLTHQVFNRYFNNIQQILLNNLPDKWTPQNLSQTLCEVESQKFVEKIQQDSKNVGICLTTSGIVQSSSLNQTKGIRAALVHSEYIAKMCRQHNKANICIIPTDCIAEKLTGNLILTYLKNDFDGEVKNKHRLALLDQFETKYLTDGQKN